MLESGALGQPQDVGDQTQALGLPGAEGDVDTCLGTAPNCPRPKPPPDSLAMGSGHSNPAGPVRGLRNSGEESRTQALSSCQAREAHPQRSPSPTGHVLSAACGCCAGLGPLSAQQRPSPPSPPGRPQPPDGRYFGMGPQMWSVSRPLGSVFQKAASAPARQLPRALGSTAGVGRATGSNECHHRSAADVRLPRVCHESARGRTATFSNVRDKVRDPSRPDRALPAPGALTGHRHRGLPERALHRPAVPWNIGSDQRTHRQRGGAVWVPSPGMHWARHRAPHAAGLKELETGPLQTWPWAARDRLARGPPSPGPHPGTDGLRSGHKERKKAVLPTQILGSVAQLLEGPWGASRNFRVPLLSTCP